MTFFFGSVSFRAPRQLLSSLFLRISCFSGSKTASWFPFSSTQLLFGLQDGFLVTFFSSSASFQAPRQLLGYLFLRLGFLSGSKTASWLPFSHSQFLFGLQDGFLVPFFFDSAAFRAPRRLLGYLFLRLSFLSGSKTAS